MRLAIFGATGRSGRILIEHALQLGHQVTALARTPERIPPHERLHVVAGDVRDRAPVSRTIQGADAVVSALGRRRRGPAICTEGMRTILSAMAADGPRRLVALSNYGVAETRRRSPYVAVSWLLERPVLRDKERMEALIRASDTDWTLIRPPILTNGPRTDRYRTGAELRLTFTSKVSRADLAAFVLSELRAGEHLRQGVAITT
ncbi:NAD(P)-dependent oxidoreductase [Streptomyces marincola]|uniref:Nucleoside-diphosphate sugar epimerase n=1 Tax=Streptomyces marincola TaxID=2878388 RepID=A0A1W7CX26_9ACTN|nr:SDR family oxidoreductase [Streptomyces marincola]ARQ69286.1 nucleoside-diphosphate sugar epimerase [Streptomyces marincola]